MANTVEPIYVLPSGEVIEKNEVSEVSDVSDVSEDR